MKRPSEDALKLIGLLAIVIAVLLVIKFVLGIDLMTLQLLASLL